MGTRQGQSQNKSMRAGREKVEGKAGRQPTNVMPRRDESTGWELFAQQQARRV